MTLTPSAAAALVAFAFLTACGPKGGSSSTAASGGPASGAPTSGPDVQVDLANMPHQKAGQWKTVLDNGDGHPADMTSCQSGKAPAVPKMRAACSQFSIKRTFMGAYVIDMHCATPNYTMTSHAVATGDFQTHVSGDTTITMSMKGAPPQTTKMHTEATWIGPCAPGEEPDA